MIETRRPTKAERKAFGRIIRNRRNEFGLTQEELAEDMGWSVHWISKIENGESDLNWKDAMTLVEAFGLSLKEILEEVGVDVPVLTNRKQKELALSR